MNEVKNKIKALNEDGSPNNPGYSYRMNYLYNRESIKVRESRIKEWDFYQFIQKDWVLQMTIGHASLFESFSINLFNINTGERFSESRIAFHKYGIVSYERDPEVEHEIEAHTKDFQISFKLENNQRIFFVNAKSKKYGNVLVKGRVKNYPENDKMVILTPFHKSRRMFYLNYKENYYQANFEIKFGDFIISLNEAHGLLDFGRGYWPFKQEWFWGSASFKVENYFVGFNIGWGFGDLTKASENMFFFNHKGYQLGELTCEKDFNVPLSKAVIQDKYGNFYLEMVPIYDNFTKTKVLYVDNSCHQVYYKVNGYYRINENMIIEFKDVTAFLEHAKNQW